MKTKTIIRIADAAYPENTDYVTPAWLENEFGVPIWAPAENGPGLQKSPGFTRYYFRHYMGSREEAAFQIEDARRYPCVQITRHPGTDWAQYLIDHGISTDFEYVDDPTGKWIIQLTKGKRSRDYLMLLKIRFG